VGYNLLPTIRIYSFTRLAVVASQICEIMRNSAVFGWLIHQHPRWRRLHLYYRSLDAFNYTVPPIAHTRLSHAATHISDDPPS